MDGSVSRIDEHQFLVALSNLRTAEVTALLAAVAERLQPLGARYFGADSNQIQTLERLLSDVWTTVSQPGTTIDLSDIDHVIGLYPDEDEPSPQAPYAQNAVGAVAYAARHALDPSSDNRTWCVRQCFEAAEVAASADGPLLDFEYAPITVPDSRFISEVEEALARDLITVCQVSWDPAQLRRDALDLGRRWARSWP